MAGLLLRDHSERETSSNALGRVPSVNGSKFLRLVAA